ncbi:MAG: ATP-dependent helicase [Mariprofundaceae bacterium]
MKLNSAQIRAVQADNGPQLILAGAGSGKTRTIVHRIGYLISERSVMPHRILAVTFTNKAASELKARLEDLIGDNGGGVFSGTFHAISLRFLRKYAEILGYERDFQVVDSDDQKVLVRRILKARNIDSDRLQPGFLLTWIDACKNAGLDPDQAGDEILNTINLRELYAVYQASLKQLGRMDFGDLLLNIVKLMRDHSDIAKAISYRFEHVLVDEYQDTNPLQQQWLQLLCSDHRNITVVGDDDQGIYGWRGADVRHILDFENAWPGSEVHRLEENYRSSGAILKLANAVIRKNSDRHEKILRTTREHGATPQWLICNDEYDEARRIRTFLQSRHRMGIPWREMAVLYRSNRQSLPIEQLIREQDIPYRVIGGVGFFERMEIKDALAYWALLHKCADSLHLLRICNKPKRGIGAKGQEIISRILSESGLRAADWLDGLIGVSGPAAKLEPLARLVGEHRADALSKPDLGLGDLLEACGYLASLQAQGQLEAESRIENIRTLQGFIEISIGEGLSPVDFMDRAALLQSGEEKAGEESVSLMSLHRAKGLEFDTVVIAGVEEGLIPHQRSLDEGKQGIAEERRLLYVGITRARDHLLLTSARIRRAFGDMFFPLPSRFINDLSANVLEREDPVSAPVLTPGVVTGIPPGADVVHPTFGEGVVLSVEGSGDATRIAVQFRRAGVKRLMLKYAALEVV